MAKIKPVPKRVFAIINGDDGAVLEWVSTMTEAKKTRAAYNRVRGYEPNCTIEEYSLVVKRKAPRKARTIRSHWARNGSVIDR